MPGSPLFRQYVGIDAQFRLRTPVGHTDLYLADSNEIVEAKRSPGHSYVRDALGQLQDYAFQATHPVSRLAALFPQAPSARDIRLLHTYGIDCRYWDGRADFIRDPAPDRVRELMRPIWSTGTPD